MWLVTSTKVLHWANKIISDSRNASILLLRCNKQKYRQKGNALHRTRKKIMKGEKRMARQQTHDHRSWPKKVTHNRTMKKTSANKTNKRNISIVIVLWSLSLRRRKEWWKNMQHDYMTCQTIPRNWKRRYTYMYVCVLYCRHNECNFLILCVRGIFLVKSSLLLFFIPTSNQRDNWKHNLVTWYYC